MENTYTIHLKVSKLENGQYLAESDDIPGLVAQGRTIAETIEIAQDVARKLIDSYEEHGDPVPASLKPMTDQIELDIAIDNEGNLETIRRGRRQVYRCLTRCA